MKHHVSPQDEQSAEAVSTEWSDQLKGRKRKNTAAAEGADQENLLKRRKVSTKKPHEFFKARTSPSGLYRLIQQLSEQQRDAVNNIGFGSLLSLGVSKCPTQISRYLVNNFDFKRRSIILNNGQQIEVDEADVQSVLNIPRGHIQIIESIGNDPGDTKYIEFLKDWRERWGIQMNKGAPTTGSMLQRIVDNKAGDNNFKIDFIVYVVSTFLWGTKNQQSRFKILKSLMDVDNIKNLNWCHFTLKALDESTCSWHKNPLCHFDGPLTFLLLGYLDRCEYRVRQSCERRFPIISCWDDNKVSKRISRESKEGGFGLGRAVARFPFPTGYVSTSNLQTQHHDPPRSEEHNEYETQQQPPVEMMFLESQNHTKKMLKHQVADAFKKMVDAAQHLAELSKEMKTLDIDAGDIFQVGIKNIKFDVHFGDEDNADITPPTEEQTSLPFSPR